MWQSAPPCVNRCLCGCRMYVRDVQATDQAIVEPRAVSGCRRLRHVRDMPGSPVHDGCTCARRITAPTGDIPLCRRAVPLASVVAGVRLSDAGHRTQAAPRERCARRRRDRGGGPGQRRDRAPGSTTGCLPPALDPFDDVWRDVPARVQREVSVRWSRPWPVVQSRGRPTAAFGPGRPQVPDFQRPASRPGRPTRRPSGATRTQASAPRDGTCVAFLSACDGAQQVYLSRLLVCRRAVNVAGGGNSRRP